MPSSSKSPQALSTKSHSFLRKSTDESPSFKTNSTSVPSEVRTSQSTNSLNPRYNESNHPEEDDVISDDEKTPEEIASAELRANRRRGYDPNSSLEENNTSFLSGVGSSVSSTPSLESAIKKKKVQSESDSDDPSSTQQVVYRKGQPTATPILIYEDSRREVVQQCIANLMSTFHLYPHSEISPVLLPKGLRICYVGFIELIKPTVMAANTGEDGAVRSSLNISVSCIRNRQMRLTRVIWR